MMNSPSLIPFDCGDDEIGVILRRALNDLRQSTDEIVSRANKRMDECQARLLSYKNRLNVVEQKFETMQKSDEIPLITSPAEFPGKVHLSRPLVFPRCSNSISPQQQVFKNDQPSKALSIKEMVLRKNGYRFIFPNGKYTEILSLNKKSNNKFASLLKENTKKQGFIKPEDFYNLKLTTRTDTLFSSNSGFASNSMLIYESRRVVDSSDPLTYKPGMGNLTEFDLPDVLPQLTGINKSAYTQKESLFGGGQSDGEDDDIFSEVTKRSLDVDLSARSTFYVPDEPASRRSTITQSRNSTPKIQASSSGISTPLPVPSTSAISLKQEPIIQPSIPEPPELNVPVAPPRSMDKPTTGPPIAPPPPPLPMNLLVSIPSPPMPGRADLMEAIRNAGGAKKAGLKKSEAHEGEETFEKPSKKPSTAAESTDDLMSSLSKALERRRKGISGKTAKKFEALEKPPKSAVNSTFSSLREIIPPPPKTEPQGSDSESANEDDWK